MVEVAGEAKAAAWLGLKKEALVVLAEPLLAEAGWLPALLTLPSSTADAAAGTAGSMPAVELAAAE